MMLYLYAVRDKFHPTYSSGMAWSKFIAWSKLFQLTELVSLDGMLNPNLVVPDYDCEEDWNAMHIYNHYQTDLFTQLDYVLQRMIETDEYNLLKLTIEPQKPCNDIHVEDFEFMGYDLMDQDFGISALSNCGGFNETFAASELNTYGLLSDFEKAYRIKQDLRHNNPNEYHADVHVVAIWRHQILGHKVRA